MRGIMVALGILAVTWTGCSSPMTTREKGAVTGGAIGAGTGAIVGSQVGHTGAGALIGAGIGVVTGAIVGDAIQGAEQKAAQNAAPVPPPPAPPAAVAAPPPPPQVAVAAPPVAVAPTLIWVPEWGMYVMQGQDIVFYNGAYYAFSGGYWWIAQAYTGPWAVVAPPPPRIAKLPPGRFQSYLVPGRSGGCPPGLAKQGRC